jgi:hypothetical protein
MLASIGYRLPSLGQHRPSGARQKEDWTGRSAVVVREGGEREQACGRRLLAASSLHAHERNRWGNSVRSSPASCLR